MINGKLCLPNEKTNHQQDGDDERGKHSSSAPTLYRCLRKRKNKQDYRDGDRKDAYGVHSLGRHCSFVSSRRHKENGNE